MTKAIREEILQRWKVAYSIYPKCVQTSEDIEEVNSAIIIHSIMLEEVIANLRYLQSTSSKQKVYSTTWMKKFLLENEQTKNCYHFFSKLFNIWAGSKLRASQIAPDQNSNSTERSSRPPNT
jgi:hypothetical protein